MPTAPHIRPCPRPRPVAASALALVTLAAASGCAADSAPDAAFPPAAAPGHADVSNRTIYEVNIRQYTPEGTFDAFRARLPRLEKLGVDVLWLMPIHPIGERNRKGTLGSYYSVRDYTAVNPEFGTADDFRELVDAAHDLGMLVVFDWVANHTAWDHPWTETHPRRYALDEAGRFRPPNPDWDDVLQLDMNNPDTRDAMLDAMRYWVTEYRVDGFRADVAELVPREFWEPAIAELRQERPLFMLAEGARPWLHEAGFDATYGWDIADAVLRVATGDDTADDLRNQINRTLGELALADQPGAPNPVRMLFTTNHDWNSWIAPAIDRFGPAWEAATVLTFTLPGVPMIYSGQEAGLDEQLAFFDKGLIDWRPHPAAGLYRSLARLRREHPAIGTYDFNLKWIAPPDPDRVIAFRRTAPDRGAEVVVLANLSAEPARAPRVKSVPGRTVDLRGAPASAPDTLAPWSAVVLVTPAE